MESKPPPGFPRFRLLTGTGHSLEIAPHRTARSPVDIAHFILRGEMVHLSGAVAVHVEELFSEPGVSLLGDLSF
jgi:hypothetical protein